MTPGKIVDGEQKSDYGNPVKKLLERLKLNSNDNENFDNAVLGQFDSLDMITISAIAIMLSDTKSKTNSPYISSMKKADISVVLLSFCKDTYKMTDIDQFNLLFDKNYYKNKINKYLRSTKSFVRKGIEDTLPKRSPVGKANKTNKVYIDKICETIGIFEPVKLISALSGNDEITDSRRNYKLDHLSDYYRDALIYLVDVLLTCTCISKMLFVERVVNNIDESSEFYRIIRNMTESINNINQIISKSRPIYKQYYQAELGYISGDDLLYGMAITIMVNKLMKKDIEDLDIPSTDFDALNIHDFNAFMNNWLDSLAVENSVDDIGALILQIIALSVKGNYTLLINALAQLTGWEHYFESRVAYHEKGRDKERYLKGDFG
ncbi:MAG: hypothetical protein FWC20_01125 [Oscillospiraceae bacterium]|nr:hypothetical protein [Oscillospiraceae bacterium]MCL2277995.1 hypothetical protein [Oscillospiraceae bacterium]